MNVNVVYYYINILFVSSVVQQKMYTFYMYMYTLYTHALYKRFLFYFYADIMFFNVQECF